MKHHPLADCEQCPLVEYRNFVPSAGPDKAKLVIVGEAPGAQEVKTGIPFTGPSGELLNLLLKHAGIDRSEVFITNVCLCRPPGNANPPSTAVRACANRLREEIIRRQPEYLVALGNSASHAVMDSKEGITKLRIGPPKIRSTYPGVRIVPTFHPAAALYNQDVFPDIVTDFGKLRIHGAQSEGYRPPQVELIGDPDRAIELLQMLHKRGDVRDIAIDIEVGVDKDVDFDHPDRYRLLCIGISYEPSQAVVFSEDVCNARHVLGELDRLLTSRRVIAQNGKFDLQGLRPLGITATLGFDTMLAHYCLDERRGTHSLDQLAAEYLGAPDWKSEIKRYLGPSKNYAHVPKDVLYKYNAYDVANTYLLAKIFENSLKSNELEQLHSFLVRSGNTLMHMESSGVAVDLDYLDQLEKEYQRSLAALEGNLRNWVGNPRSPLQVKQALQRLGVRRLESTDAETLEMLQERAVINNDEKLRLFTHMMLEYRKEHKLYGTYIKGIRERVYNGRVHPTYLLHGTVTGRLSSRNPNLQNIPRGSTARRLFVASTPDHVLIQADYRQAELRVVCGMARDAYLRDVFSDNSRDIHGEVATRFYGPGWTKEQRVRAKAVVFGLTYGREAYSLAAEFNMSFSEAKRYITQFFELIPDTVTWIEGIERGVLEGEDLVSPYGRRRRFWLITDNNRHNVLKEARAFLPQSTASDLTLESANRLADQGMASYLRIPVHDALVLEVPKEEAQDVIQIVSRTMQQTGHELFDGYVEFPVDVRQGRSWGDLE
jgi:DNA polymerase-1